MKQLETAAFNDALAWGTNLGLHPLAYKTFALNDGEVVTEADGQRYERIVFHTMYDSMHASENYYHNLDAGEYGHEALSGERQKQRFSFAEEYGVEVEQTNTIYYPDASHPIFGELQ